MKTLEDYLYPTQEELFRRLRERFGNKTLDKDGTIYREGKFLLVPGESPVLLIAHLDTVHKNPVRIICHSEDGNILMSPQGIGGDDRCGVFGIVRVWEQAEVKPWLLFTGDEETGGQGAQAFREAYLAKKLPEDLADLKMLIELDRKGKNDAVYYNCDNPDFEAYITDKGFRTELGTFSDISLIAPALGVAAVNLSCGYYNAHTEHEIINRRQLLAVVEKVKAIVEEAAEPEFPKYEYIGAAWDGYGWGYPTNQWYDEWGSWPPEGMTTSGIPEDLPDKYRELYEELLDYFDPLEVWQHWKRKGRKGLHRLYAYIYGYH